MTETTSPDVRPGFSDITDEAILALVTQHPFAWVTSSTEDGPIGTAIPVRPTIGPNGDLVGLNGHFARKNAHVQALQKDSRALFQFLGPHRYISPSWYRDRAQAPTWNFASVQIHADIDFIHDDIELRAIIDDLVGHLELSYDNAWSTREMEHRFNGLARGIIGFNAKIRKVVPKFKLSQDEPQHVFEDVLGGLAEHDASELARLIRTHNKFREADAPKC